MAEHIIAIGGGGFSTGMDPGLDLYLIEQARRPNPAIVFVGTASGDADSYVARFYARFTELDCRPSHLPFFRRTPDLRSYFEDIDVIYVGGGNTRSMLAVWREWDFPDLLRDAMQSGTILAGSSAGAICWFEQGITDSSDEVLGPLDCLGFLSGSCCPHYSGEPERRPSYEALIAAGDVLPGIALDDGAAVHFIDGQPSRIIVGRRDAGAYCLKRSEDGMAVTTPLEAPRHSVKCGE